MVTASAPRASTPAQAAPAGVGLPPLPEASGSSREGGAYEPLPPVARQVLEHLGCEVEALRKRRFSRLSELFALTLQLDKVPVVRWVAEADPDRGLVEDERTFDHGNFVHGGFLVWQKDHLEVLQKVPAQLWPCDDSQLFPCGGDPFVIGR